MNVIFMFFLLMVINNVQCSMTMAQVKSAGKMMQNLCQPKTKVSNEQLDEMHQGKFDQVPEVMCYMECILRTAQIMKEGKLNIEATRAKIDTMPPELVEPTTASLDHCKDAVKSSEKCLAAYEFYKCSYDFDPGHFFLP